MLHTALVDEIYLSEELSSPAETLASYTYAKAIIRKIVIDLNMVRGEMKRTSSTVKLGNGTIVFSQPGRLTVTVPWPDADPSTPAMEFASKRLVVNFVPLFAWSVVVGAHGNGSVGLSYPQTDTIFVRVNGVMTPDHTATSTKQEADRVARNLMDVVIVGLGRTASPLLMTTLHEITHLLDLSRHRAEEGHEAVEKRLAAFPVTDDKRTLINYGDERSALMSELITAYSAFLASYRRVSRKPFAKSTDPNKLIYVFDEGVSNNPRLSVEAFLSRVRTTRNPNAVLLYEPLLKAEARRKAAATLALMHTELIAHLTAEPVPAQEVD